uniref:14-3-3 domain-containing protein n=1 Tax=Setaria digitata TaxID=48799 RepID=A0A915Q6H6_9BILA
MDRCYSSSPEIVAANQESTTDLYISQLRHLNTFYTSLIRKKQIEITYRSKLIRQAISTHERNGSNDRLCRIQSECVDLYYYWLNDLLRIKLPYDKCVKMLHQSMVGNCYWFLAKYGHMKLRASVKYLNPMVYYKQAIAAYCSILSLIENDLPKQNEFYVYITRRFSELILDATNCNN